MANPWLRETFVIPGVAGQAARTINMIKIDDASKGQLLALLKGSTTDQGPNPMPAIGLMGHTQGDVDFPINSINVGDQNNPNHVSFDDHTVRTLHAKALCARRGLKNDDTASPKRAAIERLGRSDANAVVELDILWLTPEDEAEVISFIDPNTPEFAVIGIRFGPAFAAAAAHCCRLRRALFRRQRRRFKLFSRLAASEFSSSSI